MLLEEKELLRYQNGGHDPKNQVAHNYHSRVHKFHINYQSKQKYVKPAH